MLFQHYYLRMVARFSKRKLQTTSFIFILPFPIHSDCWHCKLFLQESFYDSYTWHFKALKEFAELWHSLRRGYLVQGPTKDSRQCQLNPPWCLPPPNLLFSVYIPLPSGFWFLVTYLPAVSLRKTVVIITFKVLFTYNPIKKKNPSCRDELEVL